MKSGSPRRILVALSVLAFVGIVLMALRPITTPNRNNTRYIEAKVAEIYAAEGGNDIVLKLIGQEGSFCIKSGLEKNLKIEDLHRKLLGERIELVYIRNWSPLTKNMPHHIAEISKNKTLIYTEFKN